MNEPFWTPERTEAMRYEYALGITTEAILARVNEMPGRQVRFEQIGQHASRIGVRRPEWFKWKRRAAQRAKPIKPFVTQRAGVAPVVVAKVTPKPRSAPFSMIGGTLGLRRGASRIEGAQ